MNSGRLLLESEIICDLLFNPSAERFPLLLQPKYGRARTFLMATLSKLLFLQSRNLPSFSSSSLTNSGRPPAPRHSDQPKKTQGEIAEMNFTRFMKPMTETADSLMNMVASVGEGQVREILRREGVQAPLIGLLRDLRGVINSASSVREFELLLLWMCPKRLSFLSLAANAWNDTSMVMIPLLKVLQEVVHNRGSRISFSGSSAGGLILLRGACRVICAYILPQLERFRAEIESSKFKQNSMSGTAVQGGTNAGLTGNTSFSSGGMKADSMSMQELREQLMAMGDDDEDNRSSSSKGNKGKRGANVNNVQIDLAPGAVGKGITLDIDSTLMKCARICVTCLTRLLTGRYANIGVLNMYGDTSLRDTYRAVLEMAFMGSPVHVMGHPKMAYNVLLLMNILADKMVFSIIDLPTPLFARIISCLAMAISGTDTSLSTPASQALESIVVFYCHVLAFAERERTGGNSFTGSSAVEAMNMKMTILTRQGSFSVEELRAGVNRFQAHNSSQPGLFGEVLAVCLDRLLTGMVRTSASNAWSLARPVLPLVLSCPNDFERYRANYLATQSPERQSSLREGLDQLFAKLSPALNSPVSGNGSGRTRLNPAMYQSVLSKNEVFTKELALFCRALRL